MMAQAARVVATDGDYALVMVAPAGACSACSAHQACGVSQLGKLLPRRSGALRIANELDALPGDEVLLGVPERALLASAAVAYLPPLAGLLAGATIFAVPHGADSWAMLGALAGLFVGLAASRCLAPGWQARHAPRMVSRRAAAPAPVRWHGRAASDSPAS